MKKKTLNLTIPMKKQKKKNDTLFALIITILMAFTVFPVTASPTLQGPTGFVQVPSEETIKAKEVEMAVHTRMYAVPLSSKDGYLTDLSFGFSPFRDFEVGVQKYVDSRNSAPDPDPTINFKVRLPSIGQGEFSQAAFGMVVDTNPNNYHTMYFTLGGFGVGWNFGGNPGYGTASFGSYNRDKKEPDSICLLIGTEYPKRNPGDRGYKAHYYADYNGDVFSFGWKYKSNRGFWIDAAIHSKTSYTDFYDYRPLIIGFGAVF